MVERSAASLDVVFQALGDPTRRRMLRALAEAAGSVGELAAPFEMSLAAVSKHVRTLEAAGLIRREVRGRVHVCHLVRDPLADAEAWLGSFERYWTERRERLDKLLGQEVSSSTRGRPKAML